MPASLLLLAMFAACGSGCARLHASRVVHDGVADDDSVIIVYSLYGGRGALASRVLKPAQPEDAPPPDEEGHNAVSVGRGLTWQTARLHILHPHPQGKIGQVYAVIRLSRSAPVRREKPPRVSVGRPVMGAVHVVNRRTVVPPKLEEPKPDGRRDNGNDELWILEFSKTELDLLLSDLERDGFFAERTRQWRPDGGARLKITIDGKTTEKAWTTEPRLDDLITRVFGEGSCLGEVPPLAEEEPDPFDPRRREEPPTAEPGRIRLSDPKGLPLPPPPSESPTEATPQPEKRMPAGRNALPAEVLPPKAPPGDTERPPDRDPPDQELPEREQELSDPEPADVEGSTVQGGCQTGERLIGLRCGRGCRPCRPADALFARS